MLRAIEFVLSLSEQGKVRLHSWPKCPGAPSPAASIGAARIPGRDPLMMLFFEAAHSLQGHRFGRAMQRKSLSEKLRHPTENLRHFTEFLRLIPEFVRQFADFLRHPHRKALFFL